MTVDERALIDGVASGVKEAVKHAPPTTRWRTATVAEVHDADTSARTIDVLIDGDPETAPTQVRTVEDVVQNDRVLIVFTPGGGAWCLGAINGRTAPGACPFPTDPGTKPYGYVLGSLGDGPGDATNPCNTGWFDPNGLIAPRGAMGAIYNWGVFDATGAWEPDSGAWSDNTAVPCDGVTRYITWANSPSRTKFGVGGGWFFSTDTDPHAAAAHMEPVDLAYQETTIWAQALPNAGSTLTGMSVQIPHRVGMPTDGDPNQGYMSSFLNVAPVPGWGCSTEGSFSGVIPDAPGGDFLTIRLTLQGTGTAFISGEWATNWYANPFPT